MKRLLIVLLLLGIGAANSQLMRRRIAPPAGGGAVTFDNAAANNTAGSSVSTPQTISYTTGGGSNMYMGVWVHLVSATSDVTGMTYNGVALAKRSSLTNTSESFLTVQYWDLVAPASGTHDLVITPAESERIAWAISTWSGVHQTTPRGTIATGEGTDSTPTVDASSAAGEVVIDGFGCADTRTAVAGAGQTSRAEIETNDLMDHSSEAGAASVTMSWAITGGATPWVIIAVPIKPA